MAQDAFVVRHGDGFELRLDDNDLALLRRIIGELRALLISENPASDPAVARLFPPAYPDDILRNLDYEQTAGGGLLAERLADLDRAEAALGAARADEDALMALMRTVNDLRLVYGTRLDVKEESEPEDFAEDGDRATFYLYVRLAWLIQDALEALGDAG